MSESAWRHYLPRSLKAYVGRLRSRGNIEPSREFLSAVQELKRSFAHTGLRIAEIGVDRGASTTHVLGLLGSSDTLDLFDREQCPFFQTIAHHRSTSQCQINVFTNTNRAMDSYFWSLAKLKAESPEICWHCVYLDGSHTYPADAPTLCVMKESVVPGGYLVLDDVNWTISASAAANTRTTRRYFTEEQMATPHVSLLITLFMEHDHRFVLSDLSSDDRAVFQRKH